MPGGNAAQPLSLDDVLSLAATPAFAILAVFTIVQGDSMCRAAGVSSLLNGMAPMYVVMSILHSAPWRKRAASWRKGGPAS